MFDSHEYIWNECEKYIQMSTNMPSFGSVICNQAFENVSILRKLKPFVTLTLSMQQSSATSRQQKTMSQMFTKMVKNDKILDSHEYIWNECEKFIQISTNMPSFGQ